MLVEGERVAEKRTLPKVAGQEGEELAATRWDVGDKCPTSSDIPGMWVPLS